MFVTFVVVGLIVVFVTFVVVGLIVVFVTFVVVGLIVVCCDICYGRSHFGVCDIHCCSPPL